MAAGRVVTLIVTGAVNLGGRSLRGKSKLPSTSRPLTDPRDVVPYAHCVASLSH